MYQYYDPYKSYDEEWKGVHQYGIGQKNYKAKKSQRLLNHKPVIPYKRLPVFGKLTKG